MKKILLSILFLVIIIAGGVWILGMRKNQQVVVSFADCVQHGYPVGKSVPRRCQTPDGQTFAEEISPSPSATPNPTGNENISVVNPTPNTEIISPLKVTGQARGSWFFEASFPVKLLDGNGKVIAQGPAQAKGDWTGQNFVPFEISLTFKKPSTPDGTLVLERDNPSGLPQNAAQISIPVKFSREVTTPVGKCFVGGCSGQICSDQPNAISTCEYTVAYACYKTATCERQTSGQCGWTQTPTLTACLQNAKSNSSSGSQQLMPQ